MKLIARHPNKAYLDTALWVPKSQVNVDGVKNALTFELPTRDGGTQSLTLWRETPTHLVLPREFWDPTSFDFPVVDCRPTSYEKVVFNSKIVLDTRIDHGKVVPTGETVQQDSMNALLSSRGGILQLACGKGKAQPVGTPVPTPQGWRSLGSLRVGDYVFGSDGEPTRVQGVFPQGKLPVFRVMMEDGTSTRCCENHLWFTQTPGDRRKKVKGQVRSLKTIRATLRTKAGTQHAVPRTVAVQYPEASTYEPWLMGFYLGDGSSGVYNRARRICFDKGDEHLLQKVEQLLQKNGDTSVRSKDTRSKNMTVRVRMPRKGLSPLWEVLKKEELIGICSTDKFIPAPYLTASEEERWGLLQGLLDADGSMTRTARSISTSSPRLRDGIIEIARSLGVRVSVEARQTHFTYLNEVRQGAPSWRLYLSHDKWGVGRYNHTQYIQEVTPAGEEECVCIKVEAEDSLYVTENFILTHNTVVAIELIARRAVPALIIVDTSQLVNQWKGAIMTFLGLKEEDIGMIGDGSFEWQKNIVIATYQTLGGRADDFPEAARRRFGTIIWDEAHHVAAPRFSRSADLFSGMRLGLTATPDREDGMHVVYNHHIGRVLYKNLTQDLKPKIYFKWTGLSLDSSCEITTRATKDRTGELHIGKVAGFFGQWRPRLEMILKDVQEAVDQGRKVIVLSNSVDEVVNLHSMWNKRNDLYTDVPFPTPADVGESITGFQLEPRDHKKLLKEIAIARGGLKDQNLNPVKRQNLEAKVAAVSHTLEQFRVWKKCKSLFDKRQREYLKDLLTMPSTGGLMIYKVAPETRTRLLKEKQVTFAISKYGREGLDEQSLDTILVCEPLSSRNGLQQLMGRVQRIKTGKKDPIVVFFEDDIGPMIGMCKKLRAHLKNWPIEEGGPYEYELLGNPIKVHRRTSWNSGSS